MLKLDNNLLQELGLGTLPDEQKRSMLQHIYETLELRVGTRLANQMTDQQLEEFEKFIDAGGDNNQAQALQWLETNLPNYKQVVNDVFEELKTEIKQMAPQILASTAGAVQPQGAPAQPVVTDPQQQTVTQPQYAQPAVQQAQQPAVSQPVYQQQQPAQPQPLQPVQDQPAVAPQQPLQAPGFPSQQPPAGPAVPQDQQPPAAA